MDHIIDLGLDFIVGVFAMIVGIIVMVMIVVGGIYIEGIIKAFKIPKIPKIPEKISDAFGIIFSILFLVFMAIGVGDGILHPSK